MDLLSAFLRRKEGRPELKVKPEKRSVALLFAEAAQNRHPPDMKRYAAARICLSSLTKYPQTWQFAVLTGNKRKRFGQHRVAHGYSLIEPHHLHDKLLHLPVRDNYSVNYCSSRGIICWHGDEESYKTAKERKRFHARHELPGASAGPHRP